MISARFNLLEVEAVPTRIKKTEHLRIVEKNIDIVAFAVANLQHHCSAATKGPMLYNRIFSIDLTNSPHASRKRRAQSD